MNLEQRFQFWEEFLAGRDIRRKRPDEEGLVEISTLPSPAERIAANRLQERWAQLYVAEHFERLGFSKVRGPFDRGPDFQVFLRGRWHWAEVETRWQNYLEHGHHLSAAFRGTKYLILLSHKTPDPDALDNLPPQIVHIDLEHFLAWFDSASQSEQIGERNSARIDAVAGEMQDHWVSICDDKERDMAVCPDCDGCPYFGEGMFDEARPHFQKLAANFIAQYALADTLEADLTRLKEADLKHFVEMNPPL